MEALPAAFIAIIALIVKQLLGIWQPLPEEFGKAAKAIELNAHKWGSVADAVIEVKVYLIVLICVLIAYFGIKMFREKQ